jgi:hypothetical protein
MAKKLYFVDWHSDTAYPSIKPYRNDLAAYEAVQSFAACKAEIIESFERQISDARYMIRHTRALRVADVFPPKVG